jgi:hypothetical protein
MSVPNRSHLERGEPRIDQTMGIIVVARIAQNPRCSILQFIHGLRGELHVTWEACDLGRRELDGLAV